MRDRGVKGAAAGLVGQGSGWGSQVQGCLDYMAVSKPASLGTVTQLVLVKREKRGWGPLILPWEAEAGG